jgi:hypothetical protein
MISQRLRHLTPAGVADTDEEDLQGTVPHGLFFSRHWGIESFIYSFIHLLIGSFIYWLIRQLANPIVTYPAQFLNLPISQ